MKQKLLYSSTIPLLCMVVLMMATGTLDRTLQSFGSNRSALFAPTDNIPAHTEAATRINFPPGGTSAQLTGQVDGTTTKDYVLRAFAGQQMQALVASPYSNVYLTIVSPGGSPLARAQAGAQSFSGALPESGDYSISISAPSGTTLTTYLLTVSVVGVLPTAVPPTPIPPPPVVLSSGTQTITFPTGSTSVAVSGQVDPNTTQTYLVNALGGQWMHLSLIASPANNIYLTLVSPGGSPLARAQAGAQSFDGQLPPENGNYSIEVSTFPGTTVTNFTLIVAVQNSEFSDATQRISFAPSATSAQVTDQLDGTTLDGFLLTASAGQQMQVAVTSPGNNVFLTVVSPGGSPLVRAQNGAQSFNAPLTETGDYNLQASAPVGTTLTSYILTVSVTGTTTSTLIINPPQRINFAPGGTSAQANGAVDGIHVDLYLLNAQAGQFLQVYVTSPANNAFISVDTPSGVRLASAPAGARNYSGTLPESGDYTFRISTSPGGALVSYTLVVSVTGAPLTSNPGTGNTTQRINFAPGGISAQVSGQVSGTSVSSFLLNARSGQRMQIVVTSPTGQAYLTVVSPGGSPLARASNGTQSFDQSLPESGDYSLQVSAPGGTPLTNFVLSVTVTG